MPCGLDCRWARRPCSAPKGLDQLLEGRTPEGMRRLMGLGLRRTGPYAAGLPARPTTLIAILMGRSHCLAHGPAMRSTTPKTITAEVPVAAAASFRPPEALAEAGGLFAGFDPPTARERPPFPTGLIWPAAGRARPPQPVSAGAGSRW